MFRKKDTGSGVMKRSFFSSPRNRSTMSLNAPEAGVSFWSVMTGVPRLVQDSTSLDSALRSRDNIDVRD